MSTKLKVFCLAVLATLAVGVVGSTSASATGTGHFVGGVSHLEIHAEELEEWLFTDPTLPTVTCEWTFEATIEQSTFTEFLSELEFETCHTEAGLVHVSMNGCRYRFTILTHSEGTQNQLHLTCSGATKHIEIRLTNAFGSCTIKVPEQTFGGGARYTTSGSSGSTHDLQIDLALTGVTSTREADGFGACAFVPTNQANGGMSGKATARAYDTSDNEVGITATGSLGS